MVATHVHDALRQVQELRRRILEKQRFKGYSGRARALSGTLALIASAILSFPGVPRRPFVGAAAWAAVFIMSVILNFGAITYWFLFDPQAGRNPARLRPVVDLLPPLGAGGIFTLALLLDRQYGYLFGTWMIFYGLANLTGRHSLPRHIAWIGLYYLAAGAVMLLIRAPFSHPLPAGAVFFAGEWAAGFVLHYDEAAERPLPQFLAKESSDAQGTESL